MVAREQVDNPAAGRQSRQAGRFDQSEQGASSRGESKDTVLRLSGVTKRYGQQAAVSDVSFSLERGKLLTLLGPSGCGKSTLLRMIAGFVAPSEGAIHINGLDVTTLAPERRPTAMVFQSYALFPHMSVFENVAFGLRLRKCAKAEVKQRVDEALDLIKMREFGQRYPSELSGGQQQRVALARCLVIKPDILLLDEPFGALDRSLREEMQIELRKLQRRLGITMLVVTHDQDEAFILSDAVAVMNAGNIEQFDRPTTLYDKPATRFVAKFMGVPNILPGAVIGEQGNYRFRLTNDPSISIPIALSDANLAASKAADSAYVALRPETLALVAASDPGATFSGTLSFVTTIGSKQMCEISAGSQVLHVVVPRSGDDLIVGKLFGIRVDPAHVVMLTS